MAKKKENKEPARDEQNDPIGYPSHPKSQDIYEAFKEEREIDPEDPTHRKESDPDPENELRTEPLDELIDEAITGDDLDIPGAELDDDLEEIGSEDEENNYYSLGGDKDLEEEHDDI